MLKKKSGTEFFNHKLIGLMLLHGWLVEYPSLNTRLADFIIFFLCISCSQSKRLKKLKVYHYLTNKTKALSRWTWNNLCVLAHLLYSPSFLLVRTTVCGRMDRVRT